MKIWHFSVFFALLALLEGVFTVSCLLAGDWFWTTATGTFTWVMCTYFVDTIEKGLEYGFNA